VVGIFDYSNAYTMKQKLTNIAGAAARAAASDPASDLKLPSSAAPVSVMDAFQMADEYILANHLNDCGAALSGTTPPLIWTYSGSTNCPPGGLTIIINRGYYFPAVSPSTPSTNCTSQALGGQTAVVATCVSISYGYQWKFGRVASLLGPSVALPATITGTAVAMNED
jgi:Flp pilus assembly protein TadG